MFELANASVFLDFDGTVTTRDVGVHLLERVGTPAWRGISEQYSRGDIGSRECSVEEWALIRGDEATLRTIAGEGSRRSRFRAVGRRAAGRRRRGDGRVRRLRLLRRRGLRTTAASRAHERRRL